jgi:hypothetical protein
MESLPEQDEAFFEAMIARRLPDLTPERLRPFAPAAEAEIARLKTLRPGERDPVTGGSYSAFWLPSGDPVLDKLTRLVEHPPVPAREHLELVISEGWVAHWWEFCARERLGYAPFRGDVDAYIERRVIDAARAVHGFLTCGALAWRPKMWHPLSGDLHRAVERLVNLRIQARGGGCENCHDKNASLDLHHLHYRSFGYEVPSDVMRLCRRCHAERHRICGYPQEVDWRDAMSEA